MSEHNFGITADWALVLIPVFLVICLALLMSTDHTVNEQTSPVDDGFVTELFYIAEMPCYLIGRTIGPARLSYDGVSCDWTRWTPPTE